MISEYSKVQTLNFYRRTRQVGLVGPDGMEIQAKGYTRMPFVFSLAGDDLVNGAPLLFPVAPVPWGEIHAVAFFDEDGNHLSSAMIPKPPKIRAQDQFMLPAGAGIGKLVEPEAAI